LFTWGSANPDLGPEEATSYELGLKGLFFDKFSLNLSGYFMDVEDEITSETIGGVTKFYNTGKTEHKGIELESSFWLTSRLNAFFNANFQEAKFVEYKSETTVYDNRWLSHVPKRTFAFGLNYEEPFGITYNLSGNYRSDSYADNANRYVIPSRIIWDTRLDFKRQFKGIDFGIYGGIRNLFDKKYYEYRTSDGRIYPAYPRNYIVGFKIGKSF
jgi:outer membrane receptor protein involved in Fe transport